MNFSPISTNSCNRLYSRAHSVSKNVIGRKNVLMEELRLSGTPFVGLKYLGCWKATTWWHRGSVLHQILVCPLIASYAVYFLFSYECIIDIVGHGMAPTTTNLHRDVTQWLRIVDEKNIYSRSTELPSRCSSSVALKRSMRRWFTPEA